MSLDKHVQATTVIDEYQLPEVVFVIDEWAERTKVDEKEIKLPEIVVGSGTMDKYRISLDPKEGVKISDLRDHQAHLLALLIRSSWRSSEGFLND